MGVQTDSTDSAQMARSPDCQCADTTKAKVEAESRKNVDCRRSHGDMSRSMLSI